jgi:hypothetical protein
MPEQFVVTLKLPVRQRTDNMSTGCLDDQYLFLATLTLIGQKLSTTLSTSLTTLTLIGQKLSTTLCTSLTTYRIPSFKMDLAAAFMAPFSRCWFGNDVECALDQIENGEGHVLDNVGTVAAEVDSEPSEGGNKPESVGMTETAEEEISQVVWVTNPLNRYRRTLGLSQHGLDIEEWGSDHLD